MREHRRVRGLLPRNITKRFTTQSPPQIIDEKFAQRWVWWWRTLPDLIAGFESRVKAGNGAISDVTAEDLFVAAFKGYSQSVTFEPFLDKLFERELEHRIDGGADWRRLPASITMPVLPKAYADIHVEIYLPANLPKKEAQVRLHRAYSDAQVAAGIGRVKLTRSNAFRGEWARRFNVIETLDRMAWGWTVDNDDAAPVRRLLSKHGLIAGW